MPSGTLERAYGRVAPKVNSGDIKNIEALTLEILDTLPDDQRFRAAAATANVSQAHLARYYLRALQMQADGVKEPQYVPNDGREVTLEHVLPENPGAGWSHIDTDIARANYNKLGNQVLLAGTVNSQLGNASFGSKKPALSQSPFSLTSQAASFEEWTAETIATRQEMLADLAVKTWPLRFR